ncbi:MAG: ABC transporter permease [Anaerolineae bacterium]|nr:ABC transporter permease [Anaerolineae bacterium]
MRLGYLVRRILFLVAVVWVAATIVFFIPRLSARNPIRERFAEIARSTGFAPKDLDQIIAAYEVKFGLDKPLLQQYVEYMGGVLRGDLGPSLTRFPKTVLELIFSALPWTIVLLMLTTLISFALGNLLGALASWPRSPKFVKGLMAPLMMLQAVPAYLLGLLLIFFIAFRLKLLPMGGAYSQGVTPSLTLEFILDAARHQILPAISLILASLGFWALGMRGMGITIQGEDYVNFAEHKGLHPRTIFTQYYVRNALLPQVTGLALAFGSVIVSGVLVEQLYGLPGLGGLLGDAILKNDYFIIYGITLFVILSIAILMFLVDLIYPLLDPRIRYESR